MFLDNTDKVIDKKFSRIIDTINTQDKDALKSMFSKQTLAEADDFNGSIEYLFEYIQGEVMSWERTGGPSVSDGKNDDGSGRIWKEIRATYDVATSKQKYHVSIQEVTKHSENSDLIGVSSLCIIKAEDWKEEYNYWGDLGLPENFETLGIVVD